MIYLYVVVALVSALLAGSGTWKVQEWRYAARDLKAQQAAERETLRRTDKIDSAAVAHERVKEVIREKFVPITERVEHEVTKVEYRDAVCLSPDGLRIIADSLAAIAPAAGKPAPTVSSPRPSD